MVSYSAFCNLLLLKIVFLTFSPIDTCMSASFILRAVQHDIRLFAPLPYLGQVGVSIPKLLQSV